MRTRAERAGDGTYRITGQKIFITYGEHDLTDNIIHLVLARLPDAPPGTRGISLFVVPKFMVNADGTLGKRNDVRAHSIEHKMGIHASPTCTMVYGDERRRNRLCGWRRKSRHALHVHDDEPCAACHRRARRCDRRSSNPARGSFRTRPQTGPHRRHECGAVRSDYPACRCQAHADDHARHDQCRARNLFYDRSRTGPQPARQGRRRAREAANERASLLTPVAKAFSTDVATEAASLGIQVHGGMGFIEETGAAQLYRDARITQIYEGTNGIQSIDLVMRKLPMSGGATVRNYIGELRGIVADVKATNDPAFGATAQRLGEAVDHLEHATEWLLAKIGEAPEQALAGATPYLRLFGFAAGGCMLAKDALAATRGAGNGAIASAPLVAAARFFATNIAVGASGLATTVTDGADSIDAVPAEMLG